MAASQSTPTRRAGQNAQQPFATPTRRAASRVNLQEFTVLQFEVLRFRTRIVSLEPLYWGTSVLKKLVMGDV
jgi:hypothetical protein